MSGKRGTIIEDELLRIGPIQRKNFIVAPPRLKRDEFPFTQLCKVKPLVLHK